MVELALSMLAPTGVRSFSDMAGVRPFGADGLVSGVIAGPARDIKDDVRLLSFNAAVC